MNVLSEAFRCPDPKCLKMTVQLSIFLHFWGSPTPSIKTSHKTLVKWTLQRDYEPLIILLLILLVIFIFVRIFTFLDTLIVLVNSNEVKVQIFILNVAMENQRI